MVRSPYVTAFLILGALALLTNPLWLFPAEGEPRHTYTRVPVEIGNDSLVYEPPGDGSDGHLNDLEGIGCDYSDDTSLPRGCAFDIYLIDHGPVTVPGHNTWRHDPHFVYLNGSHYERTKFDVKSATPRQVLGALARDASELPSDPEYASFEVRLVRRGGTMTVAAPPQDHRLGQIYRVRDRYYAVALVESAPLDRPFVSPVGRILLDIVGAGLLVLAAVRITRSRQESRVATH